MDWMLMPLKRYADFNGRSRRKEYWMFALFHILAIVALTIVAVIGGMIGGGDGKMGPLGIVGLVVLGLFALAMIVPTIAVSVRRFHDLGKSGWFYLLSFIPGVGGFIVLVFMCLEGTPGDNVYGPDPKQG